MQYSDSLHKALNIINTMEEEGISEVVRYVAEKEGVDLEMLQDARRLKRKTINRMMSVPVESRTTFRGMVSG